MFTFAFAEENVVTTFLCKVDDSIETDQYSIVVVRLLNMDTNDTLDFKLYQYNSFSERYEVPVGVYSILWARIDNRNDIVFEVKSAKTFNIGLQKSVYFELYDSNALPTTTTTTTPSEVNSASSNSSESSSSSSTEPHTLYTLYNPDTTTNADNKGDISDNSDVTACVSESTDINENTQTTTKYIQEETTKKHASEEASQNAAKIMISVFIFICIIIFAFIVIYFIKKRR